MLGETHPMIRKLNNMVELTREGLAAVAAVPIEIVTYPKQQDIVREGDAPSRSFAVLEGFTSTYKITGRKRRQICAIHIPGDMPDVQSLHLPVLDISIAALSNCRLAMVSHEALHRLSREHPRVGDALWRGTLIDAAIGREWLTSMGQRTAVVRIAHFLCEFFTRMSAVGLATDFSCEVPLTQSMFGETTGMSAVHVNRSLQELRARNLIHFEDGVLNALDWEGLKSAGDFDPTYLDHLPARPR